MSIRNVARWPLGDFIDCGYSSTDDRPLSTEGIISISTNYIIGTWRKADTHIKQLVFSQISRESKIMLVAASFKLPE
jgi:hypothetical protein